MSTKNSSLLTLLSVSLLFLPACVRKISVTSTSFVNADAIKDGFAPNSKFTINYRKDAAPSLLNQEFRNKIAKHLKKKGFHVVQNNNEANYSLIFSFDIASEQKISHTPISLPTIVDTPQGKITVNKLSYLSRKYTLFTQTLQIWIFDSKSPDTIVWQGSALNSSEDNDPRETVDYLLLAMAENFGKDTKKVICGDFSESDLKSFWDDGKKIKKSKKKRFSKSRKKTTTPNSPDQK